MTNRPVDKTKKSNIKCEHCKFWNRKTAWACFCEKDRTHLANYWSRCKSFEWAERYCDDKEKNNEQTTN